MPPTAAPPPALTLKPDLHATLDRFEAWWGGQVIDRPPVTVRVRPPTAFSGPVATHATLRERWLDVEYQVARAEAWARHYAPWVGDALPIYMPDVGPELTATLFGAELTFGADTSWSTPIIDSADGWRRLLDTPPDFSGIYWQAVERLTRQTLERAAGHFLVGLPDLHGNYDILAALRDPQDLCLDLIDEPDLVCRAAHHVVDGFTQAFERCCDWFAGGAQPYTTWGPFLSRIPAYLPSCDFWCMVNDATARDLILPSIRQEMRSMPRTLFHLDGPQAARHLDLLLDLPELTAVQWVYGAGHGPARRWIDLYRRIVAAGKLVQVMAEDADDALYMLGELGPAGVWLDIAQPHVSPAEAERTVERVRAAC